MKGFTFVETMIVLSITILLSTIAITYNRSSERQIALFKDQSVMVGFLNRAKSLTIQKYRDPALPANYFFCAFGVHFDDLARNFVVFRDLGDGGCNSTQTNYRYDPSAVPSELIDDFSLDSRVEFFGLPPGGLDILFIPPDLNVTSTVPLPATITLITKDGRLTAPTTVESAGQIITE